MGKKLKRGFYWRGDTIWIRTDPVSGKATSTRCHSARAAELWRDERERLAANPRYAASLKASVGEWVSKTIEIKSATRAGGTLHMYKIKLGHVVRIFGEATALADLTPGAVDVYIAQRKREGAGNNTITRELTCLRQMLRFAKRAGVYPLDLDEVMPVGFRAEYKPVTRTLALADVPKLLAALRNDSERAWVSFALATAADVGDIARAMPGDYDRERQVIRIRGTKNSSRDAIIPVLPHVRALLEAALPHLPVSWPRASHGVGEACARAGLPHLSPKDLRRTAASWLVASGANISHVSRFLRHRSDAMVRLVYGQIRPEELGKLIAADVPKTLQDSKNQPWPLGGTADAGDLKGSSNPRKGGIERDSESSKGSDRGYFGPGGATNSLHALALAAESALSRRRVRVIPVQAIRRRSRKGVA
jgi:integrase/recombinase XerC